MYQFQTEAMDASISNAAELKLMNSVPNDAEAESFRSCVDEIIEKVEKLEQRANEVEQFYKNASKKQQNVSKGSLHSKDKEKERHIPSIRKQQQDASRRQKAAEKRMEELMHQFGIIIRNVTQDDKALPFMQPIDVKGLGLDDYYKVIDKPMDFSTIKKRMEAKEYKNVREIYSDVRLVFKNAMKYNKEKSDVHSMAKYLLDKFEKKWMQLLPKITEEEERREEEEAEAQLDMHLAQEAAHAKMARDLSNELHEVDIYLEQLRGMVVQKCRKTSTEEKRKLAVALAKLSPEDLTKALDIVAQSNVDFQSTAEEVNLDIDTQSESTLWRLKFFVKETLENQGKTLANAVGNNKNNTNNENNKNNNNINRNNNSNNPKRNREVCDSIATTSKRTGRKQQA